MSEWPSGVIVDPHTMEQVVQNETLPKALRSTDPTLTAVSNLHTFSPTPWQPFCLVYNFLLSEKNKFARLLLNIVLRKYFVGKP